MLMILSGVVSNGNLSTLVVASGGGVKEVTLGRRLTSLLQWGGSLLVHSHEAHAHPPEPSPSPDWLSEQDLSMLRAGQLGSPLAQDDAHRQSALPAALT